MPNLNFINRLRNRLCTFEKNRQNREFYTNVGALLSSLFCLQMQVLHVILKILTSKDFLYVNQDIFCQTWRFQCIEGHTSAVKWFQKKKINILGTGSSEENAVCASLERMFDFESQAFTLFIFFFGSWVNKSMVY